MASWNQLFLDEKFVNRMPRYEVHDFLLKVTKDLGLESLRVWDLCSGAGRHTVLAAGMGHEVYGSDISENGIKQTKKWLEKEGLKATLKMSDMTHSPWDKETFHCAFSIDALHHNTLDNIKKAVDHVWEHLLPGGMFMATLLSTSAANADLRGTEIERHTYIRDSGPEQGVVHHYFDEADLRAVFLKWEFVILMEMTCNYIETEVDFYKTNPFPYTKWYLLLKKSEE